MVASTGNARPLNFGILGSRGFPSTYGGYETLVRYLARFIVRSGHDVTVYGRTREEGRRSWITEDVRCIATAGRDTKSLSTLTFGATSTLDAVFRRFDALLVVNIANGFWMPALRAAGTPFAVNTDGLEWERGKWSPFGRKVFRVGARATARFADELVCDSRAIGQVWEELFDRKSTFIPYGAPILADVPSDLLGAAGLAAGEPYLLVVARLIPENNVELTLDALDRLGDSAPRAVIVGSANFDSPLEERLRRAEGSGRLSWLGHVDDQRLLAQLWAHSAVYVHGHSVGGTNPALLQALGAGAPTLALDTVFNAEVLPAAEQRYTSSAELAAKIRDLVGSEERQDAYRRRGQEIVRTRYSWDDVCARYLNLLLRLAKRPDLPGGGPRNRPTAPTGRSASARPLQQR
jgi:glycosyltransferase involved in cell wall biosynthesis